MSNYNVQPVPGLHDRSTGALVGFLGADGKEYLFPALEGPTTGYADASATPGNATINATRGKAAIAIGAAAVTITNSLVTASSQIIATLESADATLTTLLRVVPGAGSFVVTGNANATAATAFKFAVLN